MKDYEEYEDYEDYEEEDFEEEYEEEDIPRALWSEEYLNYIGMSMSDFL